MQSSSLTIGPPRKSLYLPFNTYYMFIILGTLHSPRDTDFHFLLSSFWLETFKKTFITLVCWWWYSLVVVVCLRKYFILFLIHIFIGYRILCLLYFSQYFKMWCQCPLANIVSYACSAVIPICCSTISVFPSGYISLVDCFKQWIMICLFF